MKKSQKSSKPKVFFNASVILAGLKSPRGGSAKMLLWAKSNKIDGVTSEVVMDEAKRHANKIDWSVTRLERETLSHLRVFCAPTALNKKYINVVTDAGDVHLFSSCDKLKVDYLISLDKKHVLSLSDKISKFTIVSPGDLISALSKNIQQ